jgi:uncharacterized protein
VLNHQLPWYIGGPALGLCVVVLRLLLNERLGVTGGYSEIVERVRGRAAAFDWRSWFVAGLVVGAAVYAIVAGGPDFHGYGWMTQTFHGSTQVLIVGALLLASGVLIGFGAKTAGGCTSGNGLAGTSMLSPASLLATATFFGTAIGVSFLIKAVI